jgi:hypothetical protein
LRRRTTLNNDDALRNCRMTCRVTRWSLRQHFIEVLTTTST